MLNPGELLIGDHTPDHEVKDISVDGDFKSRGYVPRDYTVDPKEMFDPPTNIALIPRDQWAARIADKIAAKSQLSDRRLAALNGQPIPSLDQDGRGYCWAHSTTSALILARMMANDPYVRLSAYHIACIIKNYRDEGGWCGLSAKFVREKGVASVEFWPEKSTSRSNDRPEMWANAALHKSLEEWVDLTRDLYDQNLSFDQLASSLLVNNPSPVDYNWWSHSICGMDLVNGNGLFRTNHARAASGKFMTKKQYELAWGINNPVTAGYGIRIWNSWGDSWSDRGMGVLAGSKAVPDGALSIRVAMASAA